MSLRHHSAQSQGINISCHRSCLCFYADCSGCQMGKSWQRHPSPGCSLLGNLTDCQSPTGWPQLWPVLSLGLHSGTQPYPKHCRGHKWRQRPASCCGGLADDGSHDKMRQSVTLVLCLIGFILRQKKKKKSSNQMNKKKCRKIQTGVLSTVCRWKTETHKG